MRFRPNILLMGVAFVIVTAAATDAFVRPARTANSTPARPGTEIAFSHGDNDTLNWQPIALPPSNPDRLAHVTVYDPGTDRIFQIGGSETGESGTYDGINRAYDPNTDTWENRAEMPVPLGWCGYGLVNDVIYLFGGYSDEDGIVTQAYDIAANSWTMKAERPLVAAAPLSATWRDSLIYVMGGFTGGAASQIDIYDPRRDAWLTGTDLPRGAYMGSAAIIEDTIYIAQAIEANICWPNMYKGAINPANPTDITWIEGPEIDPVYNGATVALDRNVYWLGGFLDGDSVTNRVWKYSSATGVVTPFSPDYPVAVARSTFAAARVKPGVREIYGMAGDMDGDWDPPNRTYVKLSFPEPEPQPEDFVLTEPADGIIDLPVTGIVFEWSDADPEELGVTYNLYLAEAPGDPRSEAPLAENLTAPSWTCDTLLGFGQRYNWDVKAILHDKEQWSSSGSFGFTTERAPEPDDFTITIPEDDAVNLPACGFTFEWTDADQRQLGVTYDVYLVESSQNPRRQDPIIEGLTDTSWTYTLDSLEFLTGYRWDIKAVLAGYTEKWSSNGPFEFTTMEEPPILTAIEPDRGMAGSANLIVTLTGMNFERDMTVDFGEGITVNNQQSIFINPTTASADITISPAAIPGRRQVTVAVEDRRSNALSFAVIRPGEWEALTALPTAAESRGAVGRGSWLAYDNGLIYAVKGSGNRQLYLYIAGRWRVLSEIPLDPTHFRPVGNGGRGVIDASGGHLYLLHGNNTRAFRRYNITANTWTELAPVPPGPSGRPVRGGGDMVLADDAIYLLKGDRDEFWRYDIAANSWEELAPAPSGSGHDDRPRWPRGSWLAYDDDNDVIYAHKARFFNRSTPRDEQAHFMYAFDIETGEWQSEPLSGMPLVAPDIHPRRKRSSREGASGTYFNGTIYALKGGNTRQFWQYQIADDDWLELEQIPLAGIGDDECRVAAGGHIISGGDGTFYALKGNRSNQFWRYLPGVGSMTQRPGPERSGVMAETRSYEPPFVRLTPNPLSGGIATLRFEGLGAAWDTIRFSPSRKSVMSRAVHVPRLMVNVFDVTGRSVYSRNIAAGRTGSVSLDLRSLSAGIYLVQLDVESFAITQKLVVQ